MFDHRFMSHVMSLNQQRVFVIRNDLDCYRMVSRLLFDAPRDKVSIGRLGCRGLIKVLDIRHIGQEYDVGTFRQFFHPPDHSREYHPELCSVMICIHGTAYLPPIMLYDVGPAAGSLLMTIVT